MEYIDNEPKDKFEKTLLRLEKEHSDELSKENPCMERMKSIMAGVAFVYAAKNKHKLNDEDREAIRKLAEKYG